jgi:NAD-dependent deacetylase
MRIELTDPKLASLLGTARRQGVVLFLTGAGISAESGIPTFRGSEGYWSIGSENYTPMEMATRAMFDRAPAEVWSWYLYRFGICAHCEPNDAHRAIAELERTMGDGMGLITQNVDGLHQRAGSSEARTYAIHGDIRGVRCAEERCATKVAPLPALAMRDRKDSLSPEERAALTCGACGHWLRPHVLWFDEYYDEAHYRSESAFELASRASLLVVVGTTGATTLPVQIAMSCMRRGVPIVDVNIEDNPFSEMAARGGLVLRYPATVAVPAITRSLAGVTSRQG